MIDIIYILIIIVVIAVIIVWYISYTMKQTSNNTELLLNTDEDKILFQYLDQNKKSFLDANLTNKEIVAKFIKQLYNVDVDTRIIIIGNNLADQYYNITEKEISTKFSEKDDCILYLRSVIGINYEVCIINSYSTLLCELSYNQDKEEINLDFLNDIVDSNLEKTAYDHIRKVLNVRWNDILKTNNKNIIQRNADDSFLYLKPNHNIPNLTSYSTNKGDRINLLCSNSDFEKLLHRLSSSKELETDN